MYSKKITIFVKNWLRKESEFLLNNDIFTEFIAILTKLIVAILEF